ncbi:MAG: heparan-alpha-glucosaminide N-acetyltransferase domain-containing protein [Candidatus Hodarchaeota archaeon]
MKRYRSIDSFRGLCMFIMVYGHLFDWWLTQNDRWLFIDFLKPFLGPIGATGFILMSGISAGLSYRKNKLKNSSEFFMKDIRNIYLLRAVIILIISLVYNFSIAVNRKDLSFIWAWFVLQTIGFSLLLAYPFLKTSKHFRFILSLSIIIGNQLLLAILSPYEGRANYLGILYYFLFHPLNQYPLFYYFPILLIGTVVGDILFEFNLIDNEMEARLEFKNKFLYYLLPFGIILLLFGFLYRFPDFFVFASYSAIIWGFGEVVVIFSIFMIFEEFKLFKTKKSYRYLYYFSYYSFTIYLAHNLLYFLFLKQLNVVNIWIPVISLIFFFGWFLRVIHNHLGIKVSLKAGISVASLFIAKKIHIKRINLKS